MNRRSSAVRLAARKLQVQVRTRTTPKACQSAAISKRAKNVVERMKALGF